MNIPGVYGGSQLESATCSAGATALCYRSHQKAATDLRTNSGHFTNNQDFLRGRALQFQQHLRIPSHRIPPNPTTPDVAETSRRSPHVVNPVAQKRETMRADSCNNVPLKMQRAFRVVACCVACMESIVVIINDWPWNALLVPLRYWTTPTAYPIIISPLSEY